MYCQHCGTQLPPGAVTCPSCNAPVPGATAAPLPPPPPAGGTSVESLVSDVKRTAKDLAVATAKLSKRVAVRAEAAANDPSGSAKKVAHKVSKALDEVAADIDKLLKQI